MKWRRWIDSAVLELLIDFVGEISGLAAIDLCGNDRARENGEVILEWKENGAVYHDYKGYKRIEKRDVERGI